MYVCLCVCIYVKFSVPQGSVLWPLLFIIDTSDMWPEIESDMVSYEDDITVCSDSLPTGWTAYCRLDSSILERI